MVNVCPVFPFSFVQKDGLWCLVYGSPRHLNPHSKIPDTVRSKLTLLLDVESPFTNDWRDLAEYLGATNDDIKFLESRKDCHESPTQHVINVFETMNQPLTVLRDILVDLGRDDVKEMLNFEISKSNVGGERLQQLLICG